MNVVLWILQIALAVLSFSGGMFKVFSFDAVADQPYFNALPRGGWSALGAFEIVCAILLIVPAAASRMRGLSALAAAGLALESVALAILYARYSVAMSSTNPLVWVVAAALVATVVVYGRARKRATVTM